MSLDTCSEIGCDKGVHARSLCHAHYKRFHYLSRKKADLCVYCGNPRDLPYQATCESCADKNRRAQRQRYGDKP